MKGKSLFYVSMLVLAVSLLGVTATYAQGDQATLVVINYVGADLIFTLDGVTHTVPGTQQVPDGGQLALTLAPGRHDYTGAIPGGPGANGQIELAAGQTYVLGARLGQTGPVLSREGLVLEKPTDSLVWFEASLTPAAPPPTPSRSPLQPIPVDQGALVLDNYIGEELVVDINGTIYRVAANGRLQIDLPAGSVAYSASAGTSGTSGSAQVTAGQYTGLGFNRETPPAVRYDIGEPEPTPVRLKMWVTEVVLSGE